MSKYISKEYTASSAWAEEALVTDRDNPLKNITVSNDDSSNSLNIKLNDMSNDTLIVKAGEVISLLTIVDKIFYNADAGSPAFRVVCDGSD